ncbi:Methyltransferase, TsaA-like [Desulfonema limicola]|uniref:Methyltransferase, TsaA-like n=1 Tax=Desulfonema limicola TaxID=45656 RepID=A0A975BEL7_9BACT|nr:tRNA (N6-threonylcarbamoyladenosine(37)-N6)-methyltransferase TrmO [Desulfonema limicola]QTA83972.1 Methyltransferase, TsaA-like [Desulfonema limicola]
MNFTFNPIGIIHSCFKEKFGIPRQAGLISQAGAALEMLPPYDREEAFRGIEDFSHIWIFFLFHKCIREKWKPTVRPPRLGGNKRIGIFATRSGFRPNPIGLSAVKLEAVRKTKGRLYLDLKGIDFLDQTPVLDIKPYLKYSDCIPQAQSGFAPEAPDISLKVIFTKKASDFCSAQESRIPELKDLIIQMLKYDPRPAYYSSKSNKKEEFGTRIYDFDIKWRCEDNMIEIIEII